MSDLDKAAANAVDKLTVGIESAIQKAGPMAQDGWEVLLAKVRLDGYFDLGWAGLWLGIAMVCVVAMKTILKAFSRDDDGDARHVIIAVFLLLTCGPFIGIGVCAADGIKRLVIPEYYAAQHLLDGMR